MDRRETIGSAWPCLQSSTIEGGATVASRMRQDLPGQLGGVWPGLASRARVFENLTRVIDYPQFDDMMFIQRSRACSGRLESVLAPPTGVTPGLDPGVHPLRKNILRRRWIAGSSPAMTAVRV